jgi:hypothetical protein
VIAKILTHLGLWRTQAYSQPRGYPLQPSSILLRDAEHSRRAGCLPAAPIVAASPRSRGVRGARRGFLLDTRPRPAVSTRSVGHRQRDMAGEAPG